MVDMGNDYIAQNNVVAKYLRGQLTPEEAVAFEVYLMDKPALIEQLEMDRVLIKTMPEAVKHAKKTSKWTLGWFNTPLFASLFGSVATLLICVIGFSYLQSSSIDEGQPNGVPDDVIVNIPLVYLSPLRGADDSSGIDSNSAPVVSPKKADRYFAVIIQPSDTHVDVFEVQIVNRVTEVIVLQTQVVEPMVSGDIKLTLLSEMYPSGDYAIIAKAVNSPSGPKTYYFSVRHQ
jgi:hypothetical protein